MRLSFRVVTVLLTLLLSAPALHAQWFMPKRLAIDSAFRMEFLFGSQMLRSTDGDLTPVNALKVVHNPRVPVLAGTVEVSPFQLISGRISGSISVLEPDITSTRGVVNVVEPLTHNVIRPISQFVTQPDYQSWEAAGMFHLHKGGGYRFSVLAGYRQSTWHYHGELGNESGARLRDSFSSNIPFLGMQTAMFFPWWKARFEVLGSPFMNTSSSIALQRNGVFAEQNVETDEGGLIEFRVEGTVSLLTNFWAGVFACYHHQELYGRSTGRSVTQLIAPANLNNFYTRESFTSLGLNLGLVY
jgi:hypothetical protein